ncbi:hypothetical protein PV325_002129 [Microctonus aethiopoides]|nr:hypothetical protein PV325_002129 [Microctonus aethiopoides]KAK0091429.1 hypothetical protein PV326_003242 [Microctonus aethiopoides]
MCRANLTTAIKNESLFLAKIHQADYIFTGKIKELKANELHVKVKRAIKGNLNGTMILTLNDTCGFYVRKSYTGIFMGCRDINFKHNSKIFMHFGPVPLTLANLDRVNAAVREAVSMTPGFTCLRACSHHSPT